MTVVEDLRVETLRILDGVSKTPLAEGKYFRAIERGDKTLLVFPDEIVTAYAKAIRILRTTAERASVPISDAQLEVLLTDWLFGVKYGDEPGARQQIDKHIGDLLDKVRKFRQRRYLFLIPIMHMKLEDEVEIGDSTIVNLTAEGLTNLRSKCSARLGFEDDPAQAVQKLAKTNDTRTFAAVVVDASDKEKAMELGSERADMCLNILRLYNRSATFILREDLRPDILQTAPFAETNGTMSGEMNNRLNMVVNASKIDPDAVSAMRNAGLATLGDLMRKDPSTLSDFQEDVLAAVLWFGSAVKEPNRRMSFVKSFVALETLLVPDGGYGKRDRLAKRLASVMYAAGSDDVRREVYREMFKLYGIRNSIMHGGEGYIHEDDLGQITYWTQALIQVLLKHTGQFTNTLSFLEQKFPVDETIYGEPAEPSLDETKSMVEKALAKLQKNDSQLFERNVNERSITHKLAEYLQQEFASWNVDCEYNRDLDEPKRVKVPAGGVGWDDLESRTVYPDIIVHKRGTSGNLLVIEAKKSSSPISEDFDKDKLRAFTQAPFNYKFGLYILLHLDSRGMSPTLEWFAS